LLSSQINNEPQMMSRKCVFCGAVFATHEQLGEHLAIAEHARVELGMSFWGRADYFFPIIENDPLLCSDLIDDETDDGGADGGIIDEATARQTLAAAMAAASLESGEGDAAVN
jgi:hypothetical protein